MTGIVTGTGLGLFNSSSNILGGAGIWGQDSFGRTAGRSYVNAATGNLVLQMQDEVLSGRGADLFELRTYNSLGTRTDVLGSGTGWTLDAERSVAFDETTGTAGSSGTVRRTTSDGATETFTWNAALGLYVSDDGAGAQDTLSYSTSTHLWTYTDGSSRQVEVYGNSTAKTMIGKLQSQTDASGNTITYSYDSTTGRLSTITDVGSQQKLTFTYDSATGRLTTVSLVQLTEDANHRATSTLGTPLANVTYQYYGNGLLKSVTTDLTPNDSTDNSNPTKLYTTTYTYVTDPALNPNLIASIRQSDGTAVFFDYYNSGANLGKVSTVHTELASGEWLTGQTFQYSPGATSVSNDDGRTWIYKYDNQQRLIEVDEPAPAGDAAQSVTQFQYDSRGNLTQLTRNVDGNAAHNHTTIYQYDARDNRTLERDSLGDTITRAYDAKNQLITETHYTGVDSNGLDPSNTGTIGGAALTTHYIYDAQERPRFVISPEGRVTESRYESGGYGQLTRTIVYAAGRFDSTTLNASGQEAQLATWASNQDQTQTELTQYTYDLRGNLASTTAYATVNASGAGVLDAAASVMQYVYDGHDWLLQTIAMRGANHDQAAVLTSFGYDGLGREITRTNSSGTTNTVYDDAHGAIRITNASSNLQELRTFDTAGRLTSITRSDVTSGNTTPSRKTEYLYDVGGHLAAVLTIAGVGADGLEIVAASTYNFYDSNGRLQYAVDASGAVTGYAYDASGLLLSQTHYANKADTSDWVDAELDGNTGSTLFTFSHDSFHAGPEDWSDVIVDPVHDRTTSHTYDSAGRLATSIDGEGTVTAMSYDGAGRVTSVQVGTASAGYRTTQYFYDEDGNQVGVLDPLGFLTERKFDGARRLTETVRYTNRSSVTGDPSKPVWNGVANQTANIGRLFVYHLPAAYDADGDAIVYSVVSASSWLTFNAATLTVSGTPPAGTTSGSIVIKAADGTGASAKSQNVTVNVTVVNAPPDWSNIPDATVEISTTGFSVVLPDATDNETPAAQLSYSIPSSLWPPGMTFNAATKTLSGTPTVAGTYVITATVTDAGSPPLSTQRTFTLVVSNKGPSWTPDLSNLPHAFRSQAFDYVVSPATDPENQTLTYRKLSGPDWLVIADGTRPEISGTPPANAPEGTVTVVLEAKDASGAAVRLTFGLVIEGVPPTWTNTLDYSVLAGQPIDYTPPPAIDPDGGAVTYSIFGTIPPELSGITIDSATGRLQLASTDPHDLSNQSLTLRATDREGKSVLNTATIHFLDTPPQYVDGLADNYDDWQSNPKTVLIPYSTFTDINGPFTLSVDGVTSGPFPAESGGLAGLVPGLYFDPNWTGPAPVHGALDDSRSQDSHPGTRPIGVLMYYNPNAAAGSSITVTVRATDLQGLSATRMLRITVRAQPSAPPPIVIPPTPGPQGGTPPGPGQRPPPGSGPHPSVPFAPGGDTPAAERSLQPPPLTPPPPPVLGEPAVVVAMAAPPAPRVTAFAPLVDVLASVRPSNTDGLHTYIYYDGQGRVTGAVDDKGFLTETVYNDSSNTQQTIKYETALTVSASDTLAALRGRAGVADTATIAYDSFGRVSTSTALDGTVTRYEYDSAGRMTRQVVADGTSNQRATRMRYDVFSEVTGVVSGVGEATLTGTPTQAQIDTAITTYGVRSFYDSLGRTIKTTDANNHGTYFYYDADNRLTDTVDAAGEVTETAYDSFGEASSVRLYATQITGDQLAMLTGGSSSNLALPATNASTDQRTSYTYDRRGLLLTTNRAIAGRTTTNTYTAFGQLETRTDTIASGVTTTTRFAYDLDGQLILTTRDYGGLNYNSQVSYDAYGRVIRAVDGAGNTTTTNYKDSGRAIEVTDPLNRTIRDDYDAFARVHLRTDASGQVTTFDYNLAARTTTVTTPEHIQVVTTKNEFGETVSVKDGRGNTISYTYDKDGHLKTTTDAANKTTTNFYDTSGRLDHTIDARGTLIQLAYDAVDRVLTRTVDPGGLNLTTTYGYDAFGHVSTLVEGTRTTAYSYDQEGRLTETLVDPAGLRLSTRYQYDGLGNTIRVAQGGRSTPEQQVTTYAFDALGRRVKEIVAPHSESSVGIGSSNGRDLTTVYRYDSAGRVSRKIDANGNSTWYVYSAAGELRFTIDALGEVGENIYDVNGRVIQMRQYATRLTAATVAGFGDAIDTFTPPATSADDARTYHVYNFDGQERFTVRAVVGDGTGKWAVSESRYDANSNVIETRRYDQFLTNDRINANDTASSPGLSVAEVSAELVTLGYKDTALGASSTDETTLAGVDRQRIAYDVTNRIRFTVDAVGDVSERVYDEAGDVVTTVSYAAVPTLTSYSESAISSAVNRTNPENRVTQFAYDKARRLVYTARVLAVDNTGKATQQLITKQSYDTLGNVTLVRQYAATFGTLTDYSLATLDAAVNATAIVKDPRNHTTAFAYNAAGQRVYAVRVLAVDTNGVATQQLVSKTSYDGVGHVVQTTDYAAPLGVLADYNLATLDTATSAAAMASNPQNHTNALVYDPAGRVAYTIRVLAVDTTGKSTQQLVTHNVYDATGNLVQTTAYASFMELADYALSTLDLAAATRTSDQDRTSTFIYDQTGRRVYTVDSLGPDANNNPSQRVKKATYDALGRLVQTTSYAATFNLTDLRKSALDAAVIDSEVANSQLNRKTAYAYDAASELVYTAQVSEIDNTGHATKHIVAQTSYDALGQVIKTVAYADLLTLADYNKTTFDGAVAAVKNNPLNRIMAFAYNSAGERIYSIRAMAIDSSGTPTQHAIVRQTFDAFGEVVQTKAYASTPALSDYSKQTIDNVVVDTSIANNIQNRTSATAYDTLGRQVYSAQVLAVDGSGVPTQHVVMKRTYDAFDHVIQSTAYATPMALADYELATLDGAVASQTSTQDRITRYVFDSIGRARFVLGADGSLGETVYDGVDQVTESRQFGTLFTFDPTKTYVESDLVAMRGSAHVGDGTTRGETYTYDQAGRRITTTDARVAINGRSFTETSTYDGVGNLTTFVDKSGGVWTYTYDALGQKRAQVSPAVSVRLTNGTTFTGGLKTTYGYDVFGDLTSRVEAANTVDARTTTYAYDDVGRQVMTTLPGWYDPTSGQVIQVADPAHPPAGSFQRTAEITYDAFGDTVRVKSRSGASTYTYAYQAYDTLGRLAYDIDANNNITGYGYNTFGEQTALTRYSVSVPATPGPTNTTYWLPADVATKVSGDANARTLSTTYDLMGRKYQVTGQASPNYYAGSTAASSNAPTISQPPGGVAVPTTTYEYDVFGGLVHESTRQIISLDVWDASTNLGQPGVRDIQAVTVASEMNADGRLEMIALDIGGNIYHRYQLTPGGAWCNWSLLDGNLSSVALARNQDGRLELFGSNSSGAIFHRSQTSPGGAWSTWAPFPGALSSIAAETDAGGRIELFGTNSDGVISRKYQLTPGGAWSGWIQIPGGLSHVAVARNQDGRLELFGTNSNGAAYHCWQLSPALTSDVGWSNWALLSTTDLRSIAAETNANGSIEVVATNSAGQIFRSLETAPNSGAFSGWSQIAGSLSSVALARNQNGLLELIGVSSAGATYHYSQPVPGGAWATPTQFVASPPAVASETNADGRVEMFTLDGIGQIFHRWQLTPGGAWSDWTIMPGRLTSLALAKNQDGRLELFGTNGDGAIFHNYQVAAGGAWNGWIPIGGSLSCVAAETNADGRIELFGTNSAGVIVHCFQGTPGGALSDWQAFPGLLSPNPGSLAVARNQDGRLEFFGVNSSGAIYYCTQTTAGGGFSTWTHFADGFASIAAETNADGRIELAATNNAGQVFLCSQQAPNGALSGWAQLAGGTLNTVALARNQDGRLALFGATSDGTVFHRAQVTPSVMGLQRDTWHYYDTMGRETLTVDAGHYQTVRSYDALGNLTKIIESAQQGQVGTLTAPPPILATNGWTMDPNDRITIFGYDAINEQTSVARGNFRYSNALGQDIDNGYGSITPVSMTTYDALGHVKTQTDVLGNVTVMEYNALGQVTRVTEPTRDVAMPQVAVPSNPNSVPNAIDPFLNKKSVKPVTSYTLDAFGHTVAQSRTAFDAFNTNDDGTPIQIGGTITTSRTYDVDGHMTSATDGNGNVTTYQVDYAGRLIQQSQNINVTLSDWGTVTQTIQRRYVYDSVGRQTDTLDVYTDASGTLQQSGKHQDFNTFGEVIADYREWGTAATAPASLTRAIVAQYVYDKSGHQIQKTASDGITKYYYDLAGELTRQEQYAVVLNSDGTVQTNGDGTANIDTTVAARIMETGYDILGRATVVRSPGFTAKLAGNPTPTPVTPIVLQTYDRWGNVLTRTQGDYALNLNGSFGPTTESRTCSYEYNANNQVIVEHLPTVAATDARGVTYQPAVTHESHYDIAGRLVMEKDLANGGSLRARKHEYNAVGELTADVDATSVRTEYLYDSNGNRVATRNAGGYSVDGHPVASDAIVNTVFVDSYDANGNLTAHSILRSNGGTSAYISGSGRTPVLFVLNVFGYDQANRRVASADVMHDARGNVYSTYTKYDERNLVVAQRMPSVVVDGAALGNIFTTYAYDQFGNRALQLDGNLNGQTWSYRTDSFMVDQLRSSSVGTDYNFSTHAFNSINRTTTYAYNGFGQTTLETYTGSVMAGAANNRQYVYYENGLLEQVTDANSNGTLGPTGGRDYFRSSTTTTYLYSVNGDQVEADFSTSSDSEDASFHKVSDPASSRQTTMSYDARGRLIDVKASGATHATISDLAYQYDELGDRRRIVATYQRPGDANALGSDKWYDYDAEGRMTIVDGELVGVTIDANNVGATAVTYDGLGRRYTTAKYADKIGRSSKTIDGEGTETASWLEFNLQKYNYNDFGYLTRTWQAISRRKATITDSWPNNSKPSHTTDPFDQDGAWFILEDRTVDVRGAMTDDALYSAPEASWLDFGVDFEGHRVSQMTLSYLADGRLDTQLTQQFGATGNVALTTYLANVYDNAGILRHYSYSQGATRENPDFTNTYTYDYTMEFGGYKEKTITVTTQGAANPQTGTTKNQYDSHGNLIGQIIDNPGQTRGRTLYYDNDGQIISKTEFFQPTGQSPSLGGQDFFYVAGHQIAVLGTGTLDTVQFISDFTPVTTATGTAPGTYVVNPGDSLASIAQNVYGDAQLWYLIADANSVAFGPSAVLPSTEVGRTYRIPTVMTDRSNSTTFTPYNANAIIGNNTPSPYVAPPPDSGCGQVGTVVAAAVIIVAVAAVTYYTGGLATGAITSALGAEAGSGTALLAGTVGAGIGAAAGNAAGQGAGNLLGVQHGFDGTAVIGAGVGGALGSFFASGITSSAFLRQAESALGSYVGSGVAGGAGNGTNALYNFGAGYALGANTGGPGFSLSDALKGAAINALNPETGWVFNPDSRDWAHIAMSVLQPFEAQLGNSVGARMLGSRAISTSVQRLSYAFEPDGAGSGSGSGSGSSTPEEEEVGILGYHEGPNGTWINDREAKMDDENEESWRQLADQVLSGQLDFVENSDTANEEPERQLAPQPSRTITLQEIPPPPDDHANLPTFNDVELNERGYWREFVDGHSTGMLNFLGDDGEIYTIDPAQAINVQSNAPDAATQRRIDQQRLGPIDAAMRAADDFERGDPVVHYPSFGVLQLREPRYEDPGFWGALKQDPVVNAAISFVRPIPGVEHVRDLIKETLLPEVRDDRGYQIPGGGRSGMAAAASGLIDLAVPTNMAGIAGNAMVVGSIGARVADALASDVSGGIVASEPVVNAPPRTSPDNLADAWKEVENMQWRQIEREIENGMDGMGGDFRRRSGDPVIDGELKESLDVHRTEQGPGRSFVPSVYVTRDLRTIDEVGLEVHDLINGPMRAENVEMGGKIYEMPNAPGVRSLTTPARGEPGSIELESLPIPEGARQVGEYHGHAAYSNPTPDGRFIRTDVPNYLDDAFSFQDIRLALINRAQQGPGYASVLSTPGGRILVYTPTQTMSDVTMKGVLGDIRVIQPGSVPPSVPLVNW